ncbi:MAG: GNAT family N-acetyltransferase [Gemmatimonadaceae bacterium]
MPSDATNRSPDTFAVRVATTTDVAALNVLIAASARELSVGFYSPAQIDAAIEYVFGVDSQLIADGTYFVIDGDSGPEAAGGWSARRTLFGGDQAKDAVGPHLDPRADAARIRAFFVHPAFARRGLARRLYVECERAARAAGFQKLELMGTLPGEPLYLALGFAVVERVVLLLGGVDVPFTRMMRSIASSDVTEVHPPSA